MRNHIPVNVDDLPDIFDIELADEVYTLRIDYNRYSDYYTITIQKNGETLIAQEPLILGQLVGIDIPDNRLPRIDIRVMDETYILMSLTLMAQKHLIRPLNHLALTRTKQLMIQLMRRCRINDIRY